MQVAWGLRYTGEGAAPVNWPPPTLQDVIRFTGPLIPESAHGRIAKEGNERESSDQRSEGNLLLYVRELADFAIQRLNRRNATTCSTLACIHCAKRHFTATTRHAKCATDSTGKSRPPWESVVYEPNATAWRIYANWLLLLLKKMYVCTYFYTSGVVREYNPCYLVFPQPNYTNVLSQQISSLCRTCSVSQHLEKAEFIRYFR